MITLSEIFMMLFLDIIQRTSLMQFSKSVPYIFIHFLTLHSYSERSKTKCIGITIETRPDYCLKKHLG